MRIQKLSTGKFLISFSKEDYGNTGVRNFIDKLKTSNEAIQSGNAFNWITNSQIAAEADDAGYYPFTKNEWTQAELFIRKFLSQFNEDLI